jgi:hypothetical protein
MTENNTVVAVKTLIALLVFVCIASDKYEQCRVTTHTRTRSTLSTKAAAKTKLGAALTMIFNTSTLDMNRALDTSQFFSIFE